MNRLQSFFGQRIVLRAVVIATPIVAIAAVTLLWIYAKQVETETRAIIEQEQAGMDVVEQIVRRDYHSAIKDIISISNLAVGLKDQGGNGIEQLGFKIRVMVEASSIYDQIRLIGPTGDEIVRIKKAQSAAQITPPEQLQNKAQQDYFQKAIALKPGEFYISQITLSSEKDLLEGAEDQPKAIIRLALPWFTAKGDVEGLIVINYLAKTIYTELSEASLQREGTFLLLNREGNFLPGFDSGPQFDSNDTPPDLKHARRDLPAVFSHILSVHDGKMETNSAYILHHTIHVQNEAKDILREFGLQADKLPHVIQQNDWILISYLPKARVAELTTKVLHDFRNSMFTLALFLFVFICFGALLLAYSRVQQIISMARAKQLALFPKFNPGLAIRLSPSKTVILANPKSHAIFGFDPTGMAWDALQEKHLVRRHPGTTDAVQEEWLIGEQAFLFTYKHDSETNDNYVFGFDVSERKKAFEATIRLASIVEASSDAIISKTLEGVITTWNAGAEAIYGYSSEEAIGRHISFIIPEAVREDYSKIINDLLLGNPIVHYETIRQAKDGSLIDVSASISPLHDSNDQLIGATSIAREITDRKRMEKQLRDSEKLYRNTLEMAVDAIITINSKGEILEFNHTAETYFGYSKEEIIGQNIAILAPEPHRSGHQGYIDRYMKTGISRVLGHSTEISAVRKDGSSFPVDLSITEVVLEGDIDARFTGILRDITERKEHEREMRLFRTMMDHSMDSLFVVLPESGQIIDVNKAACESLGYDRAELVQKSVPEIADNMTEANDWATLLANIRSVGRLVLEGRHVHRKGHSFPVEVSVSHVMLGDTERLIAVARDITDRKRAEEALRASERWFATTLNSIGDAVIATDTRQQITYMNQIAKHLTGWSLEEAAGLSISSVMNLISSTDSTRIVNPLSQALDLLKTVELGDDALLARRDGIDIPIDDSAAPITADDGEVLGAVMIFRDITERKEAEAEMIKAKEAAEAGSRAKGTFLANMSHELRTPLNAIIGLSQVLQDEYFGNLTEKQSEYVENILSSGQHLLELINDILDLSKIEAGAMALDISTFDVYAVTETSLSIISQKSAHHNIALRFVSSEDLRGLFIDADETKYRQILYNLLSNAGKFTPDGGRIELKLEKFEGRIQVSVSDTGIGINPEYKEHVFKPFYQIKGDYQKKTPGTGLGMSLCKQMVELHDGEIWLESAGENKGTTFTFTLPIRFHPTQHSVTSSAARSTPMAASTPQFLGFEDLGKFIETIIRRSAKSTNPSLLLALRTAPPLDSDEAQKLAKAIRATKRDNDLIQVDALGHVFAAFLDVAPDHIQTVRQRIRKRIQDQLTRNYEICSFEPVEIPANSDVQPVLLKILKQLDQLGDPCHG